jgi:2-phospho-L-lactate/phosphoenolpyruvate guanylyltransferase
VPIAALIPVRSFADAKARLAGAITAEQRFVLMSRLAERTTDAAEGAGLLPAIITSDPDVMSWGIDRGLLLIAESGPGLNRAASDGVEWARSMSMEWVVLHGDLPLVQPEDLQQLVGPIEAGEAVLAPSSDGGTSAISSPHLITFSYGPGSFHRHIGALRDPRVVAPVGLLHDLDSPADLRSAITHPRGKWLEQLTEAVGR